MTLAPGTRIGPYEVLAPIGAGGMGEVYRARDGKLGRDVALKVLPQELASDSERRRRFAQEALAASALNHPNVVPVYDVGSDEGTTWIAMELVEGRTLRDVMAAGTLPTRKILDLGVQIVDGLTRAHEAGIVHRDLKPENVMVSKDGHVRILDFGLAKLVEPSEGDFTDRSTSPQITRAGTVVGTASYMSPEQAAGRAVDFRSDQFSLGTILYEMATGQKPFHRATGPETLTAILRDTPSPLQPLAPQVPAPLRWIIEERCLAKDREDRYASTRDLMRELRGLREHLSETSGPTGPAAAPIGRPFLRLAAFLLTVGAAVAFGAWLGPRAGLSGPASAPTFKRITFRRGDVASARFAPDGQTLVYAGRFGSRPLEVLSTRTGSPESRSVAPPGAGLLAISATGEMALQLGSRPNGWESTGTLARAPLAGGAPREVLEGVGEADWAPDGRTQAVVRDVGGRRRLEFPIDKVLYETAGYVSHVRVSATGDSVAFLDHPLRGDNAGSVALVDLAGRKRNLTGEFVASDGLAWSPSGEEIWFTATPAGSKSELRAVTLSGRERLLWRESGPVSLRDVSRDGRVLLSRSNQGREMAGLGPGASSEQDLTWLDWSYPVALSEDGSTLLFDEEGEGAGAGGAYAIYLRKTDGSPAVRLGEGAARGLSPDGKTVLGMSGQALLLLPIGAGMPRTLSLGTLNPQWATFFPDGRRILLAAYEPGHGSRLFVVDVAGGTPRPFTPEGVGFPNGSSPVSPDGRLAVRLDADRRLQLYPVEGGEPHPVPGTGPDEYPIRWTADGRGLYVRRYELPTRVEIVDVATGRRTPWKTLAPADPAGVAGVSPILLSGDARSYVYSYTRQTNDLYLVEGLK